jgi:hypothetical protein
MIWSLASGVFTTLAGSGDGGMASSADKVAGWDCSADALAALVSTEKILGLLDLVHDGGGCGGRLESVLGLSRGEGALLESDTALSLSRLWAVAVAGGVEGVRIDDRPVCLVDGVRGKIVYEAVRLCPSPDPDACDEAVLLMLEGREAGDVGVLGSGYAPPRVSHR